MTALGGFLARNPVVVQVVLSRVRGSSPRDAGATMYVAPEDVFGTIGGGQVEYMAIDHARSLVARGATRAGMDVPLGPEIGQCCGGRVEISLQVMDAAARANAVAAARAEQAALDSVYILGAGHVGRALADLFQHLPVRAVLVDSREAELAQCRAEVEKVLTPLPEAVVRSAPAKSAFVVLTHDHALDFLLTGEALERGDAGYVGMIGSATKRASFTRWFGENSAGDAGALKCPIGAASSGDKRPAMIAALVVAEVIKALAQETVPHAVTEVHGQ